MPDYALPEKDIHIICVDDDKDFINSMSLVLPEKMNQLHEGPDWLRFSFLDSPVDALALVKELNDMGEEIAMLISDQKMPVMKGTEFLASAKEIVPDAACVLLTGYAGIESAVDAINGKLLDRYVTKPINDENEFVLSLFQMLKTYQMGRTISNQSAALNNLYQFSNTLNSLTSYHEALDYIVNFTMTTLDCERVSIMLLSEEENPHLEIAAAKGIPDHVVKSTRLGIGERVAGTVFQKREAVYAKDVTELGYVVESRSSESAIFISVPLLWANLKSGEQPVGVINATDKKAGQVFSELDLEVLTYISNTASIAINNLNNGRKLKEAYIEKKTQAASLSHLMSHDSTTMLPNHTSFSDALRKAIANGLENHESITVAVLNLMRFRDINSSIGHQSGDLLLRNIAERLESFSNNKCQVFHFGGDEFALILRESNAFETQQLIGQIQAKFGEPFDIDGVKVDTEFTFAIASYPEHATDFKLLMQKADVALNQAKHAGRTVQVYDVTNDEYDARRLSMVNELKQAIQNDELLLHYQPKINLSTGIVEGSEALVRWIHPEHGFMPPDRFVALAEQMGLIDALTEWVVKEAAKQCAQWNKNNLCQNIISVAVNLSTLNLVEPEFAQKILSICHSAGLAPENLHLEITESVMMGDIDTALDCLHQLSDMGFEIHLDDFGTGYSSLAYVKRLPLNAIKIDRSFVMNISEDRQDVQIVQSIVELGHSLNLKLIAEGVESDDASKLLKQLNCDTVQGYHYSRPLAESDFEGWVKQFA